MRRIVPAVLVVTALWVPACGGGDDGGAPPPAEETFGSAFTDARAYPVVASPELVVGRNRLLVGLLNQNDAPIGSPDIDVRVTLYDLAGGTSRPAGRTGMDFVWIERPFRGLYVATVSFDHPGEWGAEVSISGENLDEIQRTSLRVQDRPGTPRVGERVPSSDTPTAARPALLDEITTDRDPNPRFYTTSVADALERNRPFVVVFSTPRFCQSVTCGPMLDVVKDVAADYPQVTFIHVEPYDLDEAPKQLVPVPSVTRWGLPSEPWAFVVDDRGRLVAKFAVVLAPQELRAALDAL